MCIVTDVGGGNSNPLLTQQSSSGPSSNVLFFSKTKVVDLMGALYPLFRLSKQSCGFLSVSNGPVVRV